MKKGKFTVMHTGRPYSAWGEIPAEAWKIYSVHKTESAAWKAVRKAKEGWQPGSWSDHFRVIGPDGQPCDKEAFYQNQVADTAKMQTRR